MIEASPPSADADPLAGIRWGLCETLYGWECAEQDLDADGFRCELDCDDSVATAYLGAPEVCDDVDSNCDGVLPPDEADGDADGVPACAGDCDDAEASTGPHLPEVCDNGVDDDCDGSADEDCPSPPATEDNETEASGESPPPPLAETGCGCSGSPDPGAATAAIGGVWVGIAVRRRRQRSTEAWRPRHDRNILGERL